MTRVHPELILYNIDLSNYVDIISHICSQTMHTIVYRCLPIV